MLVFIKILTVIVVALAMAPALAHALEYPGKLRLDRESYLAVQTIYYPGFTITGVAEPLAIISTAVLLVLTPAGGADFWLTLAALLGVVAMQAVYWLVTQPVNVLWVRMWNPSHKLGKSGSTFFSIGGRDNTRVPDWTRLRDRWEYSHIARSALVGISFVALVISVSTENA
jgi:hypothetical protein